MAYRRNKNLGDQEARSKKILDGEAVSKNNSKKQLYYRQVTESNFIVDKLQKTTLL